MKRYILLITILFLSIIFISCMGAVQSVDFDKDIKKPFEVKIFTKKLDKPRVAPPFLPLKFGTNQSVTWIIKDNEELNFTIRFNKDGTPFGEREFNKERSNSGRAVLDPGDEGKFYNYSVEVDGFAPIDPAIIIWR